MKKNQFSPGTHLHLCILTAFIYKSYSVICLYIQLRNIYGGLKEIRYNSNQGRYHPHLGDADIVIKRWTKTKEVTQTKYSRSQNWSSMSTESTHWMENMTRGSCCRNWTYIQTFWLFSRLFTKNLHSITIYKSSRNDQNICEDFMEMYPFVEET